MSRYVAAVAAAGLAFFCSFAAAAGSADSGRSAKVLRLSPSLAIHMMQEELSETFTDARMRTRRALAQLTGSMTLRPYDLAAKQSNVGLGASFASFPAVTFRTRDAEPRRWWLGFDVGVVMTTSVRLDSERSVTCRSSPACIEVLESPASATLDDLRPLAAFSFGLGF